MEQTYELRGKIAFIEDQLDAAVNAFQVNDENAFRDSLETARRTIDIVLNQAFGRAS